MLKPVYYEYIKFLVNNFNLSTELSFINLGQNIYFNKYNSISKLIF